MAEQVEIKTKYAGYIDRQQGRNRQAARQARLRKSGRAVSGLSKNQPKLSNTRPETLGQASRIPG